MAEMGIIFIELFAIAYMHKPRHQLIHYFHKQETHFMARISAGLLALLDLLLSSHWEGWVN